MRSAVIEPRPAVALWLFVVCGFVAAMILVGGATRLTDSGLSITEWSFAKQIVPPLTHDAWMREFALYRETTEYQVQNRGMSLADFQVIYWWEWGHRFLGKLIGVVFGVPFLVFLLTGQLKGRVLPAAALFAMGGLQGYIGWWMVESGLSGRLDVAPYRLATHLGMAFLIFAGCLALALHALRWPASRVGGASTGLAIAFLAALFVQILGGAMVAGSDAGRAFADWPTIGGAIVPAQYWADETSLRGLIENHALLQFLHRSWGYVVGGLALGLAWRASRAGEGAARATGLAVGGVALAQVALGVATVVHAAPLGLSLAHQGLAVALWGVGVAHLVSAAGERTAAATTPVDMAEARA